MWFSRKNDGRGRRRRAAESCPHCGADVPAGRAACPACGASESDGWGDSTDAWADGEEDEFDYEEFVHREFGDDADAQPRPLDRARLVLWVILVAFVAAALLPALAGLGG